MKFVIQVLQLLLLVSIIEGNFFDTLFSIFKIKNPQVSSSGKSSEISSGKPSKISSGKPTENSSGKPSGNPSEKSSGKPSGNSFGKTPEKGKCVRCTYRSYSGYCNNLENPTWGTPYQPYKRLFNNYSYKDGIHEMADLPNPRKISLQGFFNLDGTEDPKWTLNFLSWGQLIAHDMAQLLDVPETGEMNELCSCINGKIVSKATKNCTYIVIPKDDPYNIPQGKECLSFIRTRSTYCGKKSNKPAEPINSINSYLDASFNYGNNEKDAKELRSFENGELLHQIRDGRVYPPQSCKKNMCSSYSKAKDNLCLKTGDSRANQSPYITYAHIIMFRYHNNIAKKLSEINPHWDDETIFQEARRIVIATEQHVSYDEFLPILLGENNLKKKSSLYSLNIFTPFHNVYDKNVDPSGSNEMATAAFRLMHSGIRGNLQIMNEERLEYRTEILSENYDDSSLFLKNGTELGLAIGFSTQRQWKLDRYHDDRITEELFKRDSFSGSDLVAVDFQRSRDHAVAPYVVALKECGLSDPKSFDDFGKYMPKENVELLKKIYPSYDQVELRAAGFLEYVLEYGLAGPTFSCILLEQFDRTKRGDYYWYENEKQHCPFTREQLQSIKKGSTISSLICNQIYGIKKIQKRGFEKQYPLYNPLMNCKDIPTIDLKYWKDKKN